jgi:hypothetical protein
MRGARLCPPLTSGSATKLEARRHRNRSLSRRPDYEDQTCRGSVHGGLSLESGAFDTLWEAAEALVTGI